MDLEGLALDSLKGEDYLKGGEDALGDGYSKDGLGAGNIGLRNSFNSG